VNIGFLDPLYRAVAWILYTIHSGLEHLSTSSWTWGLSIVLLTVCMRLLLFPLFMKQIKSQREMQLLQPKIAELKKKFPDDRQAQSQAQMALFKEHGVNPLAGCLPLLIQMPIFFALFGVLHKFVQNKGGGYSKHYGLSEHTVQQVATSKIFGVPIAASFNSSKQLLANLNVTAGTVKTVTVVMILLMMASSFLTSRQMLARSKKSGQQLDGAQATTQKIMVYGMPLFFGIIGVNFQMGVLLYWLTTNVWTFGQQYFVIKAMGDDPEAVVRERKEKERAAKGESATQTAVVAAPTFAAGRGSVKKDPVSSPSTNGARNGAAPRRTNPGGSRPGGGNNRSKRKGGRH
jgi:YidC/Oxa1 family membrane protein insertase